MSSISAISTSGMQVAWRQLQASANNIANASTEGYARERVTQTAMLGGGVSATVSSSEVADGGAYMADDLVNAGQSVYAFVANLKMIHAEDEMIGHLLNERA